MKKGAPVKIDVNKELIEAAKQGLVDRVKDLTKDANFNVNFQEETNQQTALHFAAQNGHSALVQFLLTLEADVNIFDADENTALHLACEEGQLPVVDLLINFPLIDLNLKNGDDLTAVSIAIKLKHKEIVSLLTKAGAILPKKADDNLPKVNIFESYQAELQFLPLAFQETVSGVLYSTVLTVVNIVTTNNTIATATEKLSNPAPAVISKLLDSDKYKDTLSTNLSKHHTAANINEIYSAQGKFVNLCANNIITTNTMFSALFKEANSQNIVNTFKNDNNVVEFDDFYTIHNHLTSMNGTGNNNSNNNNSSNINNSNNSNKGNSSNASVVSGNSHINNLIMHGSTLGLQLFHKHAIIRLHISRLLTDTIYPNKPSLTLVERSIKETELLHFSVLSAHDLYRANQLQTLYEVLKHHTIPLPNFTKQLLITSIANNSSSNSITSDNNNNSSTLTTEVNVMKRRYFRTLNSFNFAQIVNTEYQKEPQVIKHYYPLTDELLYVLHFPPPNRRKNNASWNSTILPVKKVLENSTLDETKVKKSPKKSLKPKKKELEKPLETYNNVSVNTITLTPAGKAIVFIKQIISTITSIPEEDETDVDNAIAAINKTASKDGAEVTTNDHTAGNVGNLPPSVDKNSVQTTKEAWCTIHINNSVLGLRTLPIIIASAEDTSAALPEGEKGGTKSQTSTPNKSNNINNNSSNVNSTVQLPGVESVANDENNGVVATTGSFFCHTEDNVRIVTCAGPSPAVNKKPDKLGTVCFVVSYLSGLVVNICSNGTYKITPPLCMRHNSNNNNSGNNSNNVVSAITTANNTNNNTALNSYNNSYNSYTSQNNSFTNNIHAIANGPAGSGKVDPLRFEISRTVGVHGTVYRTLAIDGPYKYEILFADGTRTLYRNGDYKGDTVNNNNSNSNNKQNNPNTPKARKQSTMARKNSTLQPETHSIYEHLTEFHAELLQNAPEKWSFVNLNVNGTVLFYEGGKLLAEGETEKGVSHPTIKSTMQYTIDAETRAEIQTYTDGRMIVINRDGSKRVIFSDGTTITTHANGTVLYIEKESYPLIEIDDEVDSMCRSHSRGIEVPINKGGERVRSRLALPDGTAVMVKYDTRVTAVTNGSIKLVRRDKTTILVKDNGIVNYAPRTAWSEKDAANFASEAQDCEPANSNALPNNSTLRDTPGTAGFSPDHNSITNSITNNIANTVTSGKLTKKPNTTGGAAGAVTQNNRNKDNSTLAHMDASNPYNNGNISPRSRNSHTTGHGAKTKTHTNSITIGNKTANKLNKEGNNMNKQHEIREKESHETKFTINFINLTCKIQDYEHNCFDIDLIHNPLEPHINLSGEVEGLKPPAITDNPLEPRCFIVNRAAEATEVVSVQEIIALEDQLRLNPEECFKLTSAAEIQPSDLGPSTLSKYLVRKRLLGSCSDSFQFTEVFGSRDWHHVKLPAAASFLLRNTPALNFRRTDTVPAVPKYYQGISVIEHPPLSDGGYAQLTRDIARCEEFRENRVKSIDRFAIEDKRTEADIEAEEEAMTKRLKQAYKIAKMQAAQRKQHREKEAAAISMHNAVIPEGNNEDEEEPDNGGDDENSVKFDDEEDEVTDPVELELRATFSDFAEHYADNTANNSYASNINTVTNMTAGEYFIPKHNYQDALIRMCNCFISEALIEKSLELCHEFDSHMNELTLSEFRSLHKSVLNQLANPTAEHHIEIDDRDYKISSQYNSQLNSPVKEHHNNISQFPSVLTTPRDGSYSYRSDHTIDTFGSAGNGHGNGNPDRHHERVKPSSPHYWESPMGKKNITTLPKSAPPLDFRQLEDWSGNKVNNGNPQAFGEILSFDGDSALGEREAFDKESSPEGRGEGGNGVKYAAGSAIHAARQNK